MRQASQAPILQKKLEVEPVSLYEYPNSEIRIARK